MLAIAAGLAFALPWAGALALGVAGAADPRPVVWHEAHALAGVLFAGALLDLRARQRRPLSPTARVAFALAVASAAAFAIANAGELAALGEIFVPLYGVAMLALSAALIGIGLAATSLDRPIRSLLIAMGVTFVVALPLGVLPALGYAVLVLYGALWVALGRLLLR